MRCNYYMFLSFQYGGCHVSNALLSLRSTKPSTVKLRHHTRLRNVITTQPQYSNSSWQKKAVSRFTRSLPGDVFQAYRSLALIPFSSVNLEQSSPLYAKAFLLQLEMMLFVCVGGGTVAAGVVLRVEDSAVRDGLSLLIAI